MRLVLEKSRTTREIESESKRASERARERARESERERASEQERAREREGVLCLNANQKLTVNCNLSTKNPKLITVPGGHQLLVVQ